jgi:hypothetical protein
VPREDPVSWYYSACLPGNFIEKREIPEKNGKQDGKTWRTYSSWPIRRESRHILYALAKKSRTPLILTDLGDSPLARIKAGIKEVKIGCRKMGGGY